MQYRYLVSAALTNIVDANKENSAKVWYRRLGYIGFHPLKKLASWGKLGSFTKIAIEDINQIVHRL